MSLPILKEKISSNLRGFFSKFNVLPFIVEIKNNDLQSVINEATGYQINVRQTIPTFGMFSAEATPETIFELTKLREVAYIHFDAPKIQFSTPAPRDDALFRALDIGTRLLPQTTIPGPNFNVNVPTPQGVENFTTLVDNMLAKLFTPKGLPKFPFPEPPKPHFFDKFPDFPKPPLPFMDTEIRGDELLFGKHPVSKGEFFSTAYTRKLLGIDIAEENGFTGRGVKVSVVDTGIDEDAYQVHGVDFSNVIPGHPDVDENGHGTWCSTCVYGSAEINNYNIFVKGMAPDADAIAIKVLGGGIGTGRESDVIKGMELSYHKGAKIVSMSLGSETCNGTGPDPSTTCPECRVVKALTDIGMIFVIAAGNCLIGETLISTPKGCIPIKELQKNDLVYTYNKNPENFPKIYIKELFSNEKQLLASDDRNIFSEAIPEAKKILNLFNNGKQDVFELKTRTRTIQCTNNHPFLSIRVSKDENKQTYNSKYITEWKQLHELKSNDIIVINKKLIDIETKHKISINEMMIFGCFIGDGWLRFRERNRSEIGFCLPEYSNPEIRNKYIDLIKEVYDYKIKSNKHQIYIYNLNIAKRFSDLGFNKKAKEKHIPNWIWECNHEQKIAFLEGYIDSDGTKQKDGNISFCSPNKKLIEEIRMLCIDVGFRCTNLLLRTRDISINNGKKDYNYKKYKTYEFRLTNYSTNWKRKYSYNQLKDFRIENEYFGFEKIISIKYIGIKEVYDIEVENEHNFIANGIVVHNSGPKAQTIGCPGSSPDCISVGAISPKDNSVADFSSRGPIYGRIKPDIASYGVDIYSATSRGALLDPSGDKIIDGYTSMSGTSMATPHIAGLLTLVVEKYPDITAPQIKEIFRAKGLPKNPHTGWGIANWSWF